MADHPAAIRGSAPHDQSEEDDNKLDVLFEEVEDALAHEDIPPRVAEEIAEQVDSRKWSLEYEPHEFRFEER